MFLKAAQAPLTRVKVASLLSVASPAYRVAAGLAEERYQGEARNLVDIYGKNVAARLMVVVEDLAHEGPLADAIADEKAARNEYMNSETYAAYVRDQALRNDPKS